MSFQGGEFLNNATDFFPSLKEALTDYPPSIVDIVEIETPKADSKVIVTTGHFGIRLITNGEIRGNTLHGGWFSSTAVSHIQKGLIKGLPLPSEINGLGQMVLQNSHELTALAMIFPLTQGVEDYDAIVKVLNHPWYKNFCNLSFDTIFSTDQNKHLHQATYDIFIGSALPLLLQDTYSYFKLLLNTVDLFKSFYNRNLITPSKQEYAVYAITSLYHSLDPEHFPKFINSLDFLQENTDMFESFSALEVFDSPTPEDYLPPQGPGNCR